MIICAILIGTNKQMLLLAGEGCLRLGRMLAWTQLFLNQLVCTVGDYIPVQPMSWCIRLWSVLCIYIYIIWYIKANFQNDSNLSVHEPTLSRQMKHDRYSSIKKRHFPCLSLLICHLTVSSPLMDFLCSSQIKSCFNVWSRLIAVETEG